MNFIQKLQNASRENSSFLCVGLDPDPHLMPVNTTINEFIIQIVEATNDLVCAYKINFAFF
ncbi:MAG: orotidine 5'-phosphate decarboxylase, partial [Dehalococcoidales bacterium]|nr:orotidine 5'-phosphate decarboxylase [Dehalococcoidales bacterium]